MRIDTYTKHGWLSRVVLLLLLAMGPAAAFAQDDMTLAEVEKKLKKAAGAERVELLNTAARMEEDSKQALAYAEEAYKLAQKLKDLDEEYMAARMLADLNEKAGNDNETVQYVKAATVLATKTDNEDDLGELYTQLSRTYERQGKLLDAAAALQKRLDQLKDTSTPKALAQRIRVADLLTDAKEYAAAIKELDAVIKAATEKKETMKLYDALMQKGSTLLKQGKKTESQAAYRKAQEVAKSAGNTSLANRAADRLDSFAGGGGTTAADRKQVSEQDVVLSTVKKDPTLQEKQKLIAELEQNKDFRRANEQLKAYQASYDSLMKLNMKQNAANLERDLKDLAEARTTRLVVIGATVLSVLSVIFVVVVLVFNGQLKRSKVQIEAANAGLTAAKLEVEEKNTHLQAALTERDHKNTLLQAALKERDATIVERDQKNEELNQSLKTIQLQQEELVKQKQIAAAGMMAANVAHELNTPLGGISGSAQQLEGTLPGLMALMGQVLPALSETERTRLLETVKKAMAHVNMLNTREERERAGLLEKQMGKMGIADADVHARQWVRLGLEDELELVHHVFFNPDNGPRMLQVLYEAGKLSGSIQTIQSAVNKTQKAIFMIKELAGQIGKPDVAQPVELPKPAEDDEIELVGIAAAGASPVALLAETVEQGAQPYRGFFRPPMFIDIEVPNGLKVKARPDELAQLWGHMISNSVHALNGKGKLTITARTEAGKAVITVHDTGAGIPADVMPKIFDPFFTTKTSGSGSGMGLSLVRGVVQRLGGSIQAESQPGNTTFTVVLPLA